MLSLQVLSNLEVGSVNATGRRSVEGRGAHTAQEHEGDREIVMHGPRTYSGLEAHSTIPLAKP